MRSENLGQADVLVYEPGQNTTSSTPAGLTSLLSHVRSSQISDLLSTLLSQTVVADNPRDAQNILGQHRGVTVVTRDGDIITASRARGGSASSSSLIEIQALIADLAKKPVSYTHLTLPTKRIV